MTPASFRSRRVAGSPDDVTCTALAELTTYHYGAQAEGVDGGEHCYCRPLTDLYAPRLRCCACFALSECHHCLCRLTGDDATRACCYCSALGGPS